MVGLEDVIGSVKKETLLQYVTISEIHIMSAAPDVDDIAIVLTAD